MSRFTATLLLLFTALIWGFTFVVQKWAATGSTGMPALAFTGVRFLLGALATTPLMLWEAKRCTTAVAHAQLGGFMVCGVMLFLASWTQQLGIELTSVSNAGFFTGIYVVLTPFAGWMMFKLKPHVLVWPGMAVTTLGIWMLNDGTLTAFSTGDLWVILCSIFWALQITLVGVYAARSGRPLTMAWVQFMAAGVTGTALAAVFTPHDFAYAPYIWRELLWASVMSVGVAFTLQVIAQRHLQPAVAAIIMGSEMVFAAISGAIFLDERMSTLQVMGGALIFAAILLVEAVPRMRGVLARN
jgi:drug/metabolite transporter (DMT)-like permease